MAMSLCAATSMILYYHIDNNIMVCFPSRTETLCNLFHYHMYYDMYALTACTKAGTEYVS